MEKEAKFFKDITKACLIHLAESLATNRVIKNKNGSEVDVATAVDVSVENMIVAEINRTFPNDQVLAEEGYSDTLIEQERVWVIDPICGTTNLSRGITTYCTNIALVDKGEIIAACVVDYSEKEYIWSVGNGVYTNTGEKLVRKSMGSGVLAYVDLGCLHQATETERNELNAIVAGLTGRKGWMLISLNTSLGNMYVANGKINVVVNYIYKPWDVCASVFLVRQMGGYAVDYEGNSWTIGDNRLILGLDRELVQSVIEVAKSTQAI